MKKHIFALLLAVPLLLTGCGDTPIDGDSTGSEGSSSVTTGGNTVASVLGSFSAKSMHVVNNFKFLAGTTNIIADYVEEGCYFAFNGIGSETAFGYVTDKDNKTYKWTSETIEKVKTLVKGEELTKGGQSVSSFREVFYDPSYIGDHVADYTAENVFVPAIAGTTSGTFLLKKEVTDASGNVIKDNSGVLTMLSKALGVYDTAANYEEHLTLTGADLYFSEKGSSYTFNFYYTYDGGYDRLTVTSAVTKVGSNSIKEITDYLK